MNDTATAPATSGDLIRAACVALGLTLRYEFVPFSQSRNAANDPGNKPGNRSLNWRVTLERNGRDVVTTDYSAGIAHCPAYSQGERWTLDYASAIVTETESGHAVRRNATVMRKGAPINPDAADVIYALANDASVLDAGGFEDWANEYGFDPDSRKAESTYRACLDIALKIRAAIGDAGIEALRAACEDY
jgi:hypothetical protein